METQPKLAFIGAGNLCSSIIGGLLGAGYPAAQIRATTARVESAAALQQHYGIHCDNDNSSATAFADIVILGVKPQKMQAIVEPLAELVAGKLVISVAAGIATASLQRWLGGHELIVRSMPNTPSQLRMGATGMVANAAVSSLQRQQAETILAAVGTVVWVNDDTALDAVTAVSGSGPAYYFLFMEAMIDAAVDLGLEPAAARELTLQTALGAAQLAADSEALPAELRRRVTSPGGTTARAIESFEEAGLRMLTATAMRQAFDRAAEMATEFDK